MCMKIIPFLMLGGFILLDLLLVSRYPEKKNVIELILGLVCLLAFLFIISMLLIRRKK